MRSTQFRTIFRRSGSILCVALVSAAAACSDSGSSVTDAPALNARNDEGSLGPTNVNYSKFAGLHNHGMRFTMSRIASRAKMMDLKDVCDASMSAVLQYASINGTSDTRSSIMGQFELSLRIAPRLLRASFEPVHKLLRSCGASVGLADARALRSTLNDPPIPPLTNEALSLLDALVVATSGDPANSVYFLRTDSIRTAATTQFGAAALDSSEYALVLASAELADSSYVQWNSTMPALVSLYLDGSETGSCTASGLDPGTFGRVVGGDVTGALGLVAVSLMNPATWTVGWISAVPSAVAHAAVGAIGASTAASGNELMYHRRPRC